MTNSMRKNLDKIKTYATEILSIVSEADYVSDNILEKKFSDMNDRIYGKVIRINSSLETYHREGATLYGVPKRFPSKPSEYTQILETREDYMKIKMPMVYKKNKPDSILVADLDAAFIEKLTEGIDIPSFSFKEISFTFCYPLDTPDKYIRDNDNYNTKGIINTIVLYMRSSDRGETTKLSYQTKLIDCDEAHTIVEVKKTK